MTTYHRIKLILLSIFLAGIFHYYLDFLLWKERNEVILEMFNNCASQCPFDKNCLEILERIPK